MLAGWFTLLNRTERLSSPPDWNRTSFPHLLSYHRHYHRFLWAISFSEARRVALHWIAHHRCSPGHVGWEPYPISVRIATWCALFFGVHRAHTSADREFNVALSVSFYQQADALSGRLEWHLLGSHRFENAVALAVAGRCFVHPRATAWFRAGVRLIRRQLPEQILADEGHFERSPMYGTRILHGLRVLEDMGEPVCVRSESAEDLAGAAARLANDPEFTSHLRASRLKRPADAYDRRRLADRYLPTIERVVSGQRKAGACDEQVE